MSEYAVITAIGADRVGIVDDVTNAFVHERCNIEESRMAVLGGEFAMILLVSGQQSDLKSLQNRVDEIAGDLGLAITMKPTKIGATAIGARPYLIESVSLDSPGIVHAVTSLLRKYEINIEELDTETSAAPWTGTPMFVMKVRVSIPAEVALGRLRDEIDALAEIQDLDIKMNPIAIGPA